MDRVVLKDIQINISTNLTGKIHPCSIFNQYSSFTIHMSGRDECYGMWGNQLTSDSEISHGLYAGNVSTYSPIGPNAGVYGPIAFSGIGD